MMKPLNRFFAVSVLLLQALLLSACQPMVTSPESVVAPAAPPQKPVLPLEPAGPRPDAPPYGVRGPYAVGARDFIIEGGENMVSITIWYPALNPTRAKEEITYKISDKIPDVASLPVNGRAIQDAAPDTTYGPYPLVIFSPGLSGWRQANSYLCEHLASYGFVVIASDPRGETFEEFWAGGATRPLDTKLTLTYADKLTTLDGELTGMIDMEHIAVTGHSSGGWTALIGGGAQMDFGWCAANPDLVAQTGLSNCTQFVSHQQEIVKMLSLESVPTGMWPPMNDPRVDAVVALAPDGDIWGANYEGVAALKVPTLVMAGSGDTVNIPERCAYPIYEHLGSTRKGLIVFENADHMIFFNQCRDTPWMRDDLFWACSDTIWDMDRAHDLINHFTTAFLLAELYGDAEAAAALAPENVTFPGITYETTAYARVTEPTAAIDEAMIEKIEALVEETMHDNQIPGFAMGILKDGQMVYARGFGLAEYGTDRPMTPQTLFPMASLSKQFTTAAIMQLVEQGQIDLDAPVTTYLPYFKLADEGYQEITIRHLLANLSGLSEPDSEGGEYDFTRRETDAAALEAYVRSLAERTLVAAPGETDFLYSNRNFDILGDVIAKVSGQSYEAYVQQHLLTPLGMAKSTFLLAEADPDMLTSSHWLDEAEALVVSSTPPDYAQVNTPSQGLLSNVEDMSQWAMANLNRGELHGQRFLEAASYETMWTPSSEAGLEKWLGFLGDPFQDWGLGWALAEVEGHPLAWWGGLNIGSNATLFLAPDDGVGVVTMVNFTDDYSVGPPWYSYDIGYPVLLVTLGIEEASP